MVGGVTVPPVEAFEGRNLIFVDEGHKGSGGNVWRGYREALASTGFTFEYSATFGQALSAARKDPLTIEYGKAIAFDYSYYYFYHDGFGKDFRILNLQKKLEKKRNDCCFWEIYYHFTSNYAFLRIRATNCSRIIWKNPPYGFSLVQP